MEEFSLEVSRKETKALVDKLKKRVPGFFKELYE